ncbi:unnamed protein product [Owenia fusiformis]|uniref:Uncharacterized protein n=1 Tax=Owenia fusiformis TaxID=6347 RepID=A0A8J1Y1L3_OWEFU|nr:unnamed protein product [Owenia fusiformis]
MVLGLIGSSFSIHEWDTMKPRMAEDDITVIVRNPITHNTWDQGKFTTYEIHIKTRNRAFSVGESIVRRRYSDFVWLRKHLYDQHFDVTVPNLPKSVWFNRFSEQVVSSRIPGLKQFLDKVVEVTQYLSDSYVHLFLQTCLSPSDITAVVEGHKGNGVEGEILKYSSSQPGSSNDNLDILGSDDSGIDSGSSPMTVPNSLDTDYVMPGPSTPCSDSDSTITIDSTDGTSLCENCGGERTTSVVIPPQASSTPVDMGQLNINGDPENTIQITEKPEECFVGGTNLQHILQQQSQCLCPQSQNPTKKNRNKNKRVSFSKEVTVAQIVEKPSLQINSAGRQSQPKVKILSHISSDIC